MKYYALFIGAQNKEKTGTVAEVFPEIVLVDGNEYSIDKRYAQELIGWLVECPSWVVSGASFDGATWLNPSKQTEN